MNQLNARQKQAVQAVAGPVLVLAGAGSGKTSVITRKIAWLIESCGYAPRHIAAVTFTNKAAREMRDRVARLLQNTPTRGLRICTFHTLGLDILRQELGSARLRPGFTLFDQADARLLIKGLLEQEGQLDTSEAEVLQQQISDLKNEMKSPARLLAVASSPGELRLATCYQRYEEAMRAYNAVDFDDLILKPALLFRDDAALLQRWRQRLQYVLVDEYQDTNESQYQLVRMLTAERQALTVVGDDDQSIYAWRGARPENLEMLTRDYPTIQVIKLEQNYRSTSRILRVANTLIAHNPHVFEKKLWSESGPGDEIRVLQCKDEEAESERLASELINLKLTRGLRFRDFAILYRSNHQARVLEMRLQAWQVPYRMSGGTSFFSRSEVKDAMAYLRLLANPDDDAAFLRVINVPRREIGTATLSRLGDRAGAEQCSLYATAGLPGLHELVGARAGKAIDRFLARLAETREAATQDESAHPLNELFASIDYDGWLTQTSSSPAQTERRRGNVRLLIDQFAKMREEAAADPLCDAISLQDAVSRLVLRDILEQQDDEDDADQVHLSTLHAAKGLEYPHVFIMGLEEDILPHRNSIEADAVEEERRLFYVGITRARKTLHLTLCEKRRQYGELVSCTPSRFLAEMPEEDVVWSGREEKDPVRNKARGRATLDALFRQLSDEGS